MSWFTCALWAVTYLFVPLPDITAAELACICSHNACIKEIAFASTEQFEGLPSEIKRHFQPKDKQCVK
jgi:hypothetical protein